MLKIMVLVVFGIVGVFGIAALISRLIVPDWEMEMIQERLNEANGVK